MALKKKTNDWIEGYIFGMIEPRIIEGLMHGEKELNTAVSVPKVWFGLREYKSKTNTLADEHIREFQHYLNQTLCNYNTNKTIYDYTIDIFPFEQYMRFAIVGVRREPVKEMTIAEIEKELGYKIKVIGDKDETAHYEVYCPHRINGCCTICENRECTTPRNNCKGFAFKKL